MAEAFYNKYAMNSKAHSAGSDPANDVNPMTVKVLSEIGIDIGNKKPSAYGPFINIKFDYIVTMGCKDECPITPREKTIKWDIPDPKGKGIEEFRKIRELIGQKVKILRKEIGD